MTTPTTRSVSRTRTGAQRVETCPLCAGSKVRLVWQQPRPDAHRVWSIEGYLETVMRWPAPILALAECPCPTP